MAVAVVAMPSMNDIGFSEHDSKWKTCGCCTVVCVVTVFTSIGFVLEVIMLGVGVLAWGAFEYMLEIALKANGQSFPQFSEYAEYDTTGNTTFNGNNTGIFDLDYLDTQTLLNQQQIESARATMAKIMVGVLVVSAGFLIVDFMALLAIYKTKVCLYVPYLIVAIVYMLLLVVQMVITLVSVGFAAIGNIINVAIRAWYLSCQYRTFKYLRAKSDSIK